MWLFFCENRHQEYKTRKICLSFDPDCVNHVPIMSGPDTSTECWLGVEPPLQMLCQHRTSNVPLSHTFLRLHQVVGVQKPCGIKEGEGVVSKGQSCSGSLSGGHAPKSSDYGWQNEPFSLWQWGRPHMGEFLMTLQEQKAMYVWEDRCRANPKRRHCLLF